MEENKTLSNQLWAPETPQSLSTYLVVGYDSYTPQIGPFCLLRRNQYVEEISVGQGFLPCWDAMLFWRLWVYCLWYRSHMCRDEKEKHSICLSLAQLLPCTFFFFLKHRKLFNLWSTHTPPPPVCFCLKQHGSSSRQKFSRRPRCCLSQFQRHLVRAWRNKNASTVRARNLDIHPLSLGEHQCSASIQGYAN